MTLSESWRQRLYYTRRLRELIITNIAHIYTMTMLVTMPVSAAMPPNPGKIGNNPPPIFFTRLLEIVILWYSPSSNSSISCFVSILDCVVYMLDILLLRVHVILQCDINSLILYYCTCCGHWWLLIGDYSEPLNLLHSSCSSSFLISRRDLFLR